MAFDVITFAATKADLDNLGRISTADASSIAVVASMLGNPLTGLLIGRSMADKRAPVEPAPQAGKPVIDLTQPPRDATGISPTTGLPGGIDQAFESVHRQAQAFISEARSMLRDTQDAARSARNAADEAKAAALAAELASLTTLQHIKDLKELKGNGPTPPETSDEAAQSLM